MLLTEHNVCYYLLEKGMLDLSTLLKGTFTARRSDSRNNNIIINKEYDNHKYFIKQVKAQEAEKIETLRTEANCYKLANTDAQYKALKQFLPSFHYYDPLNNILIVEQVKEAYSVHDYYFQLYNFQNNLPQLLADLLASYHSTISNVATQQSMATFRKQRPWVFSIVTTPPVWLSASPQSVEQQTIQLIFKNPEFVQLLSQTENDWQIQSLIHNDIKFNNILLNYDFEHKKINAIKLIDWELADIGDPLWDTAAMLHNYLFMWLSTDIPQPESYQPIFKKITLTEVQPCINQFWQRYVQQMKWPQPLQKTSLVKAVKYAALKMIHSCFEIAPASTTLQPLSVKMLQTSFNILRSPEDAAIRLFGIK